MRKLIVLVVLLLVVLGIWNALEKYAPGVGTFLRKPYTRNSLPSEKVKVVDEESVVVDIVDKVSPSVVTVGIEQRIVALDPFDPFGMFQRPPTTKQNREQDIGSGFIISADGLIVTNKHVVSQQGKYKVITNDGKKYEVKSVYRDPSNDVAVIKIDATGLRPVEMGDSSKVKVGQLVVAVGTPLGEFRGSVTKGIVSGLGRGINAGSPFEGFAERLDNVIQTDAAINPGNSGGPLVNSSGQVIGVNTAIASDAQNIGFAIPINVIKDALGNFKNTGGFSRAYLGVGYRMINRDVSIVNGLPEGAYIQQVVDGSPAGKAGLKQGDIIIRLDGQKIEDKGDGLAVVIGKKKVGDFVTVTIWREDENSSSNAEPKGKTSDFKVVLEAAPEQ